MAIGGYSLVAVRGLLIAVASLIAEQGFWSTSSVLVARGLSSSTACGVFSNQGSNPCLLLWQADSLPLSHQGSPDIIIFLMVVFIYFWLYWVFVAARAFLRLANRGYSSRLFIVVTSLVLEHGL